MYNEGYEDYIRNILGYPNQNNNYPMYNANQYVQNSNNQLENYYPEIYRIIYPMINTACKNNTRVIDQETINSMVDEIYFAVEVEDEEILDRDVKEGSSKSIKESTGENRQVRRIRNRTLHDLIRILLIRELIRRPRSAI